ncbi:MAG: COX15/CtaA family protein [Polyangiaceae bacterium]
MPERRVLFSRLASTTLVATLGVILWGAYVRASGSGAGCGRHWPVCNGAVVPPSPTTATLIEYTHRLTSGLSLILVVAMTIAAFKIMPRGHVARRASAATLFFMLTEAAVGAALVLFEKVAGDKSLGRAWFMGAHLINTFLLLGSLSVVVWSARASVDGGATAEPHRFVFGQRKGSALLVGSGLFAVLATGVTGAIAALGDTLFPARSLAEGLAADLDAQAHLFVQLRALHPFVAVASAVHLIIVASTFARSSTPVVRRAAHTTGLFAALQVALGIINLVLLAPIAMQLVHLLVADFLWMSLVVLAASAHLESASAHAVESDAVDEHDDEHTDAPNEA